MTPRTIAALLATLATILLVAPALALNEAQEQLATQLEELMGFETPTLLGEPLMPVILLSELYAAREFRPIWDTNERMAELITMVHDSFAEGLDPEDYHLAALTEWGRRRKVGSLSEAQLVDLEILLTESFVRLAYHLRFGKVDPNDLDADWNFSRAVADGGPVANLMTFLEEPTLLGTVRKLRPRAPIYVVYRDALARHRTIADDGGWPSVPEGPVLNPGVRDPRVLAVRKRLRATGELADESDETNGADSDAFDHELVDALEQFQRQHRLAADGVIGPATLKALNATVEDRIAQIRVNLERLRWVFYDMPPELIVVNVAGFEVLLIEGREVRWRSRAVVGKTYRKTPIFKASLKYLVFNPTWTVPPTVLKQDILPAIQRDPGYLERKNMNILTRDGAVVDPATFDWPAVTAANFGHVVRQGPGPTNALGLVKFIFPNPYFVFMHDTPSRQLFDRDARTFSSGCIRVEHPFELAEILLDDPVSWNGDAILAVIESGSTRTVFLEEPLPVYLLYWTVDFDLKTGDVFFLRDIYDRDGRILAALDGDFVYTPPEGVEQYISASGLDVSDEQAESLE